MVIQEVYDANIYFNNVSTHGTASEVTCPDITPIMGEYKALGMAGTLEFFKGFEKLEATIKWKYAAVEIRRACANFIKPVDIMVRSRKARWDSGGIIEDVPVVIYLKGTPTKHQGGGYKPQEASEFETAFTCFYFKEEINGEEIIEVDVMNNIYKVDGEDLLAEYRQNLGI
jgi:P2 family phage contractile tail tube protein